MQVRIPNDVHHSMYRYIVFLLLFGGFYIFAVWMFRISGISSEESAKAENYETVLSKYYSATIDTKEAAKMGSFTSQNVLDKLQHLLASLSLAARASDTDTINNNTSFSFSPSSSSSSSSSSAVDVLQSNPSVANFTMQDVPLISPTVPVSVVIPCTASYFVYVPRVLLSIAKQTKRPEEVIFILNVKEGEEVLYDQNAMLPETLLAGNMNVRVFVRGGENFPGSNRVFGAAQAKSQIISFFDCDDYMHPQRIQAVWNTFNTSSELDGLVHGLTYVEEAKLDKKVADIHMYSEEDIHTNCTKYTSDEIYTHMPSYDYPPWNITNRLSEPNWPGGRTWWFPLDVSLHFNLPLANGWLSVRKNVLQDIPYPFELIVGEDSLYNWRLIKSKKNFAACDMSLGFYVRLKSLQKLKRVNHVEDFMEDKTFRLKRK